MRYSFVMTANYPNNEICETDTKRRTKKELFEAIDFCFNKHHDASSFVFSIVRHEKGHQP